ncbi:PAS domain-containing hybrid sensor histidine kinase/response regulator [Anaeromyxobacter diazotrophicus]|uniref:histidine kinase n=1 Tax=Anaeromyxobacter diazotrophicus TaxID=2590199 RepID=A0A7I9VHR4_9BACT|nr:PAS domain S-box protein [Anaeromyxobacter diazotrophicus]GEJ55934.1 hypothetical protein AMYX_06750 [Anaeromyxobacter diazotrophicus]
MTDSPTPPPAASPQEQAGAATQRLDALLENSPLAVIEWSTDFRISRWSDEATRMFGWTAAEAVGNRINQLNWVYAEDWPLVEQVMGDMLSGRRPRNVSRNRNVRKDGTVIHCEWYNSTVAGPDGRLASVLSLVLDVTEQKRAEEALREGMALLRAISDTSTDAIYAKSREGQLRFANPATVALIGKPLAQVLGRTDAELLEDPEVARVVMENDRRIMESGAPAELEERVPMPDGTDRVWLSRKVPYRDAAGRVVGLLGISRDITGRKQHEEELREADRRKDEFLGMLSHELRNPLAPIRNSIYLLSRAAPESEQARRARAIIERQTDHLTRLVDDLLDVTRIARGKVALRRERVDLREVVARAAEDLRSVLEGRGVSFSTALPAGDAWADADATRVAQIVGNLLHNAAKFTRPGDAVTLSLSVAGGQAEIRVRDTGAGIEPALLGKVFEPFVQGERTLARTEGGLGLGLSLVKGVAALHGGSVEAASAGKGRGAEFVVRLPLAEGGAVAAAPAPAAAPASQGRRVLIVDDNADAAGSLADVVALLGHEVDVAHDGPAALERARARPPDVVLCDLGLPGMSGYEVARALRAGGGGMRLVAVSGYAQPEDVEAALKAGFDHHLAKPASPEDLARLLA